jgi:tetratricopeptide (TPR) repeat protein
MNDSKATEKAYLDGMSENPNRAYLHWLLGSWYEKSGRFDDAESMYRKGCELPLDLPDFPQTSDVVSCFRHLAALLSKHNLKAEGIQVLERGISSLEKNLVNYSA